MLGDGQHLAHVFPVGMWVGSARLRPDVVDRAAIGSQIKKGARGFLQDPIAIRIALEVALGKSRNTASGVFSDANDVPLFEYRARGAATIRASQTIGLGKCGFMGFMKRGIQIRWGVLFPIFELELNQFALPRSPQQVFGVARIQCGSWNCWA